MHEAYGIASGEQGAATTYPLHASKHHDDPSEQERLTEILATVAHELRTPASLIAGLASTITVNGERMTSDQVSDLVIRLEHQCKRLMGLLDNMLDLSRIELGSRLDLAFERVELAQIIGAAVAAAGPPQNVRLTADVTPGLMVWSDPHALERALVNLLRNAFRYGGPNVTIEARPALGGATLSVIDDGPGVSADILPVLYEPFRASEGGTGLGLVIVKAITEASGGGVWYEAVEPTGSRFTMRLRDEPDRKPEPRASVDMRARDHPPIVLIVDDEPDVLFLLRLTLEHGGYHVEEAPHGGAALELIGRLRPDLVITDLMMPVLDGRELIRRLRGKAGTATVPIMLLSASPDTRSGADRVIRKPFDPRQLMSAIEELVGGRR